MLINPHGYHEIEKVVFFLRNRNQLAPFYILTIVLMVLRNNYFPRKYGKLQLTLTFIICTFMIFHAGSGSNIIAWFPISFYLITPVLKKNSFVFNIRTYIISYVALYIAIIGYGIQERYSDLIYKLLGRSATFSGRTLLWELGLGMIKKKPIIGYGMADTSNMIISPISGRHFSAHNQLIQLMIEGGIISLFAFANLSYLIFNKLYMLRKSIASKILSIGIFAISLVLFSEAMGYFDILILYAFSYNVDKILKF